MGSLVEESLQKAVTALVNQDRTLALQVVEEDVLIDTYQKQIENACTKIIALEQPVAGDLRRIITVIKIVSHLERIGDHARHLAGSLITVDRKIMDYVLSDIQKISKAGIEMLHISLTAFSRSSPELAESISEINNNLENYHGLLYNKIINMMKDDPETVEQGSTVLFISRFLERLGDHVLMICSAIIYADTGSMREL